MNRKGFTLVEILIVAALIALFAGMAIGGGAYLVDSSKRKATIVEARTVAHDLGKKLGCGAHLASLRRVQSGKFDVAHATPLQEVLAWSPAELESRVLPFLKITAM